MSWQMDARDSVNEHGVTGRQVAFVRALQKEAGISNAALDLYCQQRFRASFEELNRAMVSKLIDDMKDWKQAPAELQRAMGQRDLPGFGE